MGSLIEVTAFGSRSPSGSPWVWAILKIGSGLALEAAVIQLALALNDPVLRDDHDGAASAAAHLVAGGAQQPPADEVLIAAPEDQQICPVGRGCGG